MKILVATLAAALLSARPCLAQASKADLTQIRVTGVANHASQTQVARQLGKPLAVVEPHYECGEFSSEQTGQKIYELRYRQAVFIGNSQQGYELQSFQFAPAGRAQLAYGRTKLSAATTRQELIRLLGTLKSCKQKNGLVEVVVWQEDASATFTFKSGRLVSYTYHGMGC